MKRVTDKIKPVSGFSHILHLFLTVLLPLVVYVLIRLNLVQLAVIVIVLSKWRMFSVRPRYWAAIIRANAVDIIIGLSTVIFMINTSSGLMQLIWAVAYAMWLVLIKPSASLFGVSMQALVAFVYGLSAVYLEWGASEGVVLLFMTWLISYAVARHFFTAFEETHAPFLANIWALFGACLAWLLSHYLWYFNYTSQVTMILVVAGFGLGTTYYLNQLETRKKSGANSRVIPIANAIIVFHILMVAIINISILVWLTYRQTNII